MVELEISAAYRIQRNASERRINGRKEIHVHIDQ
jgi:hypothetical protein